MLITILSGDNMEEKKDQKYKKLSSRIEKLVEENSLTKNQEKNGVIFYSKRVGRCIIFINSIARTRTNCI